MFQKTNLWLLIAILIAIMGCRGEQGPQGPPAPESPPICVFGFVYGPTGSDTTSSVGINVYLKEFLPEIPLTKINDIEIPAGCFGGNSFCYSEYDLAVNPGDSANLTIGFTKVDGSPGTVWAKGVLPGKFAITSHDTASEDTIMKGDSVTVTWAPSSGASYYFIDFYFYYHYIDTSGNDESFSYSMDTTLTDTSITFPASMLFPNLAEIDSVRYGYGHFDIEAIHGPVLEGGSEGNVSGDGLGFYLLETEGGDLQLTVAGSLLLVQRGENPKERIRKILKEKAMERLGMK